MWLAHDHLINIQEERRRDFEREVEKARLVKVALEAVQVQPCAEPAAEVSSLAGFWQTLADHPFWPVVRRRAPCV
jgi:hypothetical protein